MKERTTKVGEFQTSRYGLLEKGLQKRPRKKDNLTRLRVIKEPLVRNSNSQEEMDSSKSETGVSVCITIRFSLSATETETVPPSITLTEVTGQPEETTIFGKNKSLISPPELKPDTGTSNSNKLGN